MPRSKRLSITLISCFVLTACSHQTIKPFLSDGCSSFPDGTATQNTLWLKCCTVHDFAYWQGGSYIERENADDALRACVKTAGQPGISLLMMAGVRVGGTPLLPTPFRWGYGWSYIKWYGELTAQELTQVKHVARETTPLEQK